jgi:hypothetical protein
VSKLSSAFTEIIAPYPRLLLRQIASRIDHVTEKQLLPIYVDIGAAVSSGNGTFDRGACDSGGAATWRSLSRVSSPLCQR